MTDLVTIDWSTINLAALRKLPAYTLPPSYRLQEGMGNGCAGDPPGYPTYFTRSVYTRHGNSPRKGPELVICYPGEGLRVVAHSEDWEKANRKAKADGREYATWDDVYALQQARLHRLWNPLPLEHPRVQAWIADRIRHFKGCRVDPRKSKGDRVVIKPVWSATDYIEIARLLGEEISEEFEYHVDGLWGKGQPETWPEADRLAWSEITALVLAGTDAATFFIREYYLDYMPTDPAPAHTGNWYERLAERPTPETCPGETPGWGNRSSALHPVNGNSCQVCGWNRS